jgi:hypothetical protein
LSNLTYLSDEALREPWIARAVESLLTTFDKTSKQPVVCGSSYHAARALVQYERRVFLNAPATLATATTK